MLQLLRLSLLSHAACALQNRNSAVSASVTAHRHKNVNMHSLCKVPKYAPSCPVPPPC